MLHIIESSLQFWKNTFRENVARHKVESLAQVLMQLKTRMEHSNLLLTENCTNDEKTELVPWVDDILQKLAQFS